MSPVQEQRRSRTQALGQLVRLLASRGGLVLVRGEDSHWHRSRLPPARGSGSYLEVLSSGELRQWLNDGRGNYRTLRLASAGSSATPLPGPSGFFLRRYSAGRSALEACPTEIPVP